MVTIRAWRESDLEACARLYALCFAKSWTYEDFAQFYHAKNLCGYVAFEKDQLVGFVIAQTAGMQADIITLVTHPTFRRKGIARSLITFLIDNFSKEGGEQLFLEVAQGNLGAFSLYQSLGFNVCGKRQFYYTFDGENHENAYVMSLFF